MTTLAAPVPNPMFPPMDFNLDDLSDSEEDYDSSDDEDYESSDDEDEVDSEAEGGEDDDEEEAAEDAEEEEEEANEPGLVEDDDEEERERKRQEQLEEQQRLLQEEEEQRQREKKLARQRQKELERQRQLEFERQRDAALEREQRRRPSGRVRFDTSRTVRYANTLYCEDDVAALWYNASELEVFKIHTSKFVRSMTMGDDVFMTELGHHEEFRVGLLTAFEVILVLCTQENEARERMDVHNLLNDDQRKDWRTLYNYPERLGLERNAILRIRKDKSARRFSLVTSLKKMTTIMANMDPDERAELMCGLSERISLPSRVFAEEMGKALHVSCLDDQEHERQQHGGFWTAFKHLSCAIPHPHVPHPHMPQILRESVTALKRQRSGGAGRRPTGDYHSSSGDSSAHGAAATAAGEAHAMSAEHSHKERSHRRSFGASLRRFSGDHDRVSDDRKPPPRQRSWGAGRRRPSGDHAANLNSTPQPPKRQRSWGAAVVRREHSTEGSELPLPRMLLPAH